jgi:hypothetical protein
MLKPNSEATVDIEIVGTSLATIKSIGYLELLASHQANIAKEILLESLHLFSKYFFNLNLPYSLSSPLNAYWFGRLMLDIHLPPSH